MIDKEKRREGARRLRLKPDGVYGRLRKMCKDRYVLIGLVTMLVFRGEEWRRAWVGTIDKEEGLRDWIELLRIGLLTRTNGEKRDLRCVRS